MLTIGVDMPCSAVKEMKEEWGASRSIASYRIARPHPRMKAEPALQRRRSLKTSGKLDCSHERMSVSANASPHDQHKPWKYLRFRGF